jgi:Co/Zn/Cd efflux system component
MVMGMFGVLVLARALWQGAGTHIPEPQVMEVISLMAFAANGAVALLLYAFRDGDANMRSVWLCTRNDMINNLAVLLAAVGVFGTKSGWPDIAVAVLMTVLGLSAAYDVIGRARVEMHTQ